MNKKLIYSHENCRATEIREHVKEIISDNQCQYGQGDRLDQLKYLNGRRYKSDLDKRTNNTNEKRVTVCLWICVTTIRHPLRVVEIVSCGLRPPLLSLSRASRLVRWYICTSTWCVYGLRIIAQEKQKNFITGVN